MSRRERVTTELCIERSKEVHGDLYLYDKSVYKGNNKHMTITCRIHGDFEQNPSSHWRGKGCRKCANEARTFTQEQYIDKVTKIHNNKYDYSKSKYVNNRGVIIITCPVHGDYTQTARKHMEGSGCHQCVHDDKRLEAGEVKSRFNSVHKEVYNYDKVDYKSYHEKVCIICPEHGEFWQTPSHHLQGKGCPNCGQIKTGKSIIKSSLLRKPISFVFDENGDSYLNIPLKEGVYCKADIEDYDKLSKHVWSCRGKASQYAVSTIGGKPTVMHRFVMNAQDVDEAVDHKYHDTLDNRKVNLRICTHKQNMRNSRPVKNTSSKYKGVSWSKSHNRWYSCIYVGGKTKNLGLYESEEEAARVYDKSAREHFKEYAYLNFPNE